MTTGWSSRFIRKTLIAIIVGGIVTVLMSSKLPIHGLVDQVDEPLPLPVSHTQTVSNKSYRDSESTRRMIVNAEFYL